MLGLPQSLMTYTSEPSSAPPGIIRTCFGLPTADEKTIFGLSPPAKPALMMPDGISSMTKHA